jgi:spore photoproduct lyase
MTPSKLFIHREVAESPLALKIQNHFSHIPFEVIDDIRAVYESVTAIGKESDYIQRGKEVLFLTENKGAFIKPCPGTREYTCCGYKILHIGTFCIMDCSYCILQAYFHPPVLQYFINHDELLKELDSLFLTPGIHRVGTGEFTDSMIWEFWTDTARLLVPKFATQKRAVLELKTKTVAIDSLRDLIHNQKTIAAWSLNTLKIIRSEERGTASLKSRIDAAAACESWGYPLAFHFDPMVIYDGCQKDYEAVIRMLFSRIRPESVVWISLGTFRFMPPLKSIIQERFPDSKIVYGEFITGLDGKMRYFKPLRIALYRHVISCIKDIAPNVLVYFCMEDDEVWEKSMGFPPSEKGGLENMLDRSAEAHCRLSES